MQIVTEIETLIGARTVDEWDFVAIEMVARRNAVAVEQRLNANTSDHAGTGGTGSDA